jgi:hypothetical protein
VSAGARKAIATGIACALLGALPAAAFAATDRADYAAQVNSICAGPGGNDLTKLAALRKVVPAPGDEALVSSWLEARERRLDLRSELSQIDRRVRKLVKKTRATRSIATLIAIDRKVKKLDRRAAAVQDKLITAEVQDDELGTLLGATACVIDIQ